MLVGFLVPLLSPFFRVRSSRSSHRWLPLPPLRSAASSSHFMFRPFPLRFLGVAAPMTSSSALTSVFGLLAPLSHSLSSSSSAFGLFPGLLFCLTSANLGFLRSLVAPLFLGALRVHPKNGSSRMLCLPFPLRPSVRFPPIVPLAFAFPLRWALLQFLVRDFSSLSRAHWSFTFLLLAHGTSGVIHGTPLYCGPWHTRPSFELSPVLLRMGETFSSEHKKAFWAPPGGAELQRPVQPQDRL